jgi:hypothetical protein
MRIKEKTQLEAKPASGKHSQAGKLAVTLCFLLCSGANSSNARIFQSCRNAPADTASNKSLVVLQAEIGSGGMLYNNANVRELFGDVNYTGFNLRAGWQTQGDNVYYRLYNYPIYGIGIYASTFKRAEIGTPFALYGFVSVPFASGLLKKCHFNYRISVGIAGNFNPYDSIANPNNTMSGSSNNVYLDFGLQFNYKLTPQLQLGFGCSFVHFSNGSIRKPNLGINLVPLTFSVAYRYGAKDPVFVAAPIPPHRKNSRLHLSWAFGVKQFNIHNSRRYFKSTLGFYWSRSLGYKFRLGIGGDLYYSASGNHREIAGDQYGKFSSLFSGGPAIYIDNVLTENLYLNGNAGYYLHRNEFNDETKPVFLRIGIRYRFPNNLFAGVSIKAHSTTADFVEIATGWTF